MSNFAIKISGDTESFYPLYDNGRSLFYQDSESLVKMKCADPILYCNSFGPIGTQWDALNDMLSKNPLLRESINLDISDEAINTVLQRANFTGYRYEGAKVWIRKSIDALKELILKLDAPEQCKNRPSLNDQIESASICSDASHSAPEQEILDTPHR